MKGKIFRLSLLASLIALMTACTIQPAKEEVKESTDTIETEKVTQTADGTHTLSVQGTGEVWTTPTIARLSIGVNARGETAEAAHSMAMEKIKAFKEAVKETGVDEKDVQTSYHYIYEDSYNTDTITYIASSSIDVTIRDISKVSTVMQASLTDGATMINGMTFDITKAERIKLYNEAMQEAIAEGQAKANGIASSMGVTLGAPKSIIESTSDMMAYKEYGGMGAGDEVDAIEPGQISVTANVNLVYNY